MGDTWLNPATGAMGPGAEIRTASGVESTLSELAIGAMLPTEIELTTTEIEEG